MKTFQFNPSKTKLDAFNDSLARHSAAHEVVDVRAVALKNGDLVISVVHADDLVESPVTVLQPMVVPYSADQAGQVGAIAEAFTKNVVETSTEDEPRAPAGLLVAERSDGSGYLVFLVNVGALEVPEEAGE
jgi:hypothetical protein